MHKMEALRIGDKIGIVAPGAMFNHERFYKGIEVIKSWGLVPVFDKNLFKKDLIFAGTAEQRFNGFKQFIFNDQIKAIWTVRGGAGSYSVAPFFENFKLPINLKPKPLIGLSDITALHLVWNQKFKWPSLHAPMIDRMGSETQPDAEKKALKNTLFNPDYRLCIKSGLKFVGARKRAEGELCGGNLSLLCSSMGTSWEIETNNKILFLEEIGEPGYRIDRMLTQLKSAGKLSKIKALLLGDFTECTEKDGREIWRKIIQRHFTSATFPVVLGVKSGHGEMRLPLPLGKKLRIGSSQQSKAARPLIICLEGFAD